MTRLPNWEQALADYLAAMETTVFEWGKHDCALFVADAVLAMTGVDHVGQFRGRYRTRIGSLRALRRYGAGTLEATIDTMAEEKPIGFAQRGDLVMHEDRVGVCIGADAMFIGQEGDREGLVRVPRREWRKAWAV